MIRVEHLTKRYGATTAIEDVSFEVPKGQVVGFLGPNGAGKSTTMRILTGSLGATEGRATVDGRDVFTDAREVKRRIGYLPEVPPLYPNMVVRDYVAFAGQLKGVKDPVAAAERAIARVGLAQVGHRIIEHLSKGYRQRVGLAQALVHDPEVLILDEPNSGLDPAQRVEIRDLLHDLVEDKRTIILSTHVLADIEAICRRVIIINKGRIVAEDDIERLGGEQRTVTVAVARGGDAAIAAMRAVEGVSAVVDEGEGRLRLTTDGDRREHVANAAAPFGLLELSGRARLEEIYLRLTMGANP